MHRAILSTLRQPETPREYFDERHGPGAFEIQQARADAVSAWKSAFRMLDNARAWRAHGDEARARMCVESALIGRRNAKTFTRHAAEVRARVAEWQARFCARPVYAMAAE